MRIKKSLALHRRIVVDFKLNGKVALVTESTAGIVFAIAESTRPEWEGKAALLRHAKACIKLSA